MSPDIKAQKNDAESMNSVRLRSILGLVLVVVIVSGVALYYLGFQSLEKYAVEVSHRVTDADASSIQVQGLQALKSQIDQDEQLIAKAEAIFATQDSYQARAIKDVQKYAKLAGLTVESTSFSEMPSANTRTFSVSLGSTVSYRSLIAFLSGIESNVPKLQVKKISIGRSDAGGDSVTINTIVMSILVR